MPRKRPTTKREPITLLEVVVVGTCIFMWAYLLTVALGWSPLA